MKTYLSIALVLISLKVSANEPTRDYLVSPFLMSWAATRATVAEFPKATTDAISAITGAERRDFVRLLRRDAKSYLLGSEMSDALADQLNYLRQGARLKGESIVLEMSDRELTQEILLHREL